MLKTLKRLYERVEESMHIIAGEPDGRVRDEVIRPRDGAKKEKKAYRDRWKDAPRETVEKEEPEDYEDKVKDVCFICGHHIKKSLERYMESGNICVVCNNRVNRVMKDVITHEEAMEELRLRRKV